jgi:hypothetical protein
MKSMTLIRRLGGCCAALGLLGTGHSQVTIDGERDVAEGYALLANQTTVSNWNEVGPGNNEHEALANIHALQVGDNLAIHLAARGKNRGILLFIDSRPGGRTFISNPLITSGEEEQYINNLGLDANNGMTFEAGFEPDYALRIYPDGGTGAFVNLYDLNEGTRVYAGNAGVDVISSRFIRQMHAPELGSAAIAADTTSYAAANKGVEMLLDLAALGVPSGPQTVKLMALLVNDSSTYASNQVLGPRTSATADIGNAINSFDFETEPGVQTLSVAVTGPPPREVVFSVNMNDEIAKGFFSATTDEVKVLFFTGLASPLPGEITLEDPNSDGIYTGSLMATGAEGDFFGRYKFFNTRGTPNFGYEYGDDRNFQLGPQNSTQNLPVALFRANSFALWSGQFSGGQTATEDYDGDGLANIVEYFMGTNNSAFTQNPAPVNGVISWPRDPFATGISFKVWKSATLATDSWEEITTGELDLSDPGFVKFTLPDTDRIFVRLAVTEEIPAE